MASRLTTLIVISIVAATFIAGIIARAQRDDDGPVDLIVFNGRVYTRDRAFAEAVAVRGNTIVRVGANREIKRLRRPQTTYIDAHGGAVLPGFNDAHVHFMDGSLALADGSPTPALGPPDRLQQLAALRAGIQTANSLGITSVQNAAATPEQIELWEQLRAENRLTVRTSHALSMRVGSDDALLEVLERTRRRFGDDPMLKTGSIEIAPEPTAPVRTRRRQRPDPHEEFQRLVMRLDRRGWHMWIRADDQDALQAALDALEAAVAANPAPDRARRHRIEYRGELTPEEAARMLRLGAVASLQVLENGSNAAPAAELATDDQRFGWRVVESAGVTVAVGSDWPAAPLDPRETFRRMLEQAAGGSEDQSRAPLPPFLSALDAYTKGAAYASSDEDRKGTIADGMLADMVILSADIFRTPGDALADVHVEKTIFDGEVVYSCNDGH